MSQIIQFITEHLSGLISKEMIVFVISMVPILELRGGIIASALMDIPMWRAVLICGLGNLVPVPFALLLLSKLLDWMKSKGLFKKQVEWIEDRAAAKSEKIGRFEFWGLLIFVGIPLPGTGAWTGSLAAAIMGMKFRKSFPAVLLGICMAMVIMTAIFYLMPSLILG